MDAENISSHAPYAAGVSIDTSHVKPRYINAHGTFGNQAARRYGVDEVAAGHEETRPREGISSVYVKAPHVGTMGLDPMVSSAAVIHELAYGRMSAAASPAGNDKAYVMRGAYVSAQLDLMV